MNRPLARFVANLRRPVPAENRRLLAERWRQLPPELQDERQVVGRFLVQCGFTLGAAYCSFGCTHCYLPRNANRVPLPSLAAAKAEIDAHRRRIGAGGGLQITGGDVVDAYWRAGRAGDLVAVVRHAVEAGLVPMLMTHGQVLLDHPGYLERLVREGGLRKVSFHVDVTQAGRPGFPRERLAGEADLNPLRRALVDLVLSVRRRTGRGLSAAHTVTVTGDNLDGVGEVMRWLLADPRHLEAFHTVSFQPEAAVGRTRSSARRAAPAEVWRRIGEAAGVEPARDGFWAGHPDCSSIAILVALFPGGRVLDAAPDEPRSRAFWSALMSAAGGYGGRREDAVAAWGRRLGLALRHPRLLASAVALLASRLRAERVRPVPLAVGIARGRVRGLNVLMHNFMGADELAAPRSPTVERRLAACAFRGVVERDGRWEAVPMCAFNADERETLYDQQIQAGGLRSPAARVRSAAVGSPSA